MGNCKHSHGFELKFARDHPSIKTKTGLDAIWLCNYGDCQFYLNFNPELYPEGIAYRCDPVEKKEITFKPSLY